MFTGLIESVGTVVGLSQAPSGWRLRMKAAFARELSSGESVAVNGVCLTVTGIDGEEWSADIGPETARLTTLGTLRTGDRINLERSMRADSRVGGHFVQGHVDGRGVIQEIRPDGDSYWLAIGFEPSMSAWIVRRGSIAVDGISLTIAGLETGMLQVMIIPFTWMHTNLPSRQVGDQVNLECDMIGKYVTRAVEVFEEGRERV